MHAMSLYDSQSSSFSGDGSAPELGSSILHSQLSSGHGMHPIGMPVPPNVSTYISSALSPNLVYNLPSSNMGMPINNDLISHISASSTAPGAQAVMTAPAGSFGAVSQMGVGIGFGLGIGSGMEMLGHSDAAIRRSMPSAASTTSVSSSGHSSSPILPSGSVNTAAGLRHSFARGPHSAGHSAAATTVMMAPAAPSYTPVGGVTLHAYGPPIQQSGISGYSPHPVTTPPNSVPLGYAQPLQQFSSQAQQHYQMRQQLPIGHQPQTSLNYMQQYQQHPQHQHLHSYYS